jgi:hypothetical protein
MAFHSVFEKWPGLGLPLPEYRGKHLNALNFTQLRAEQSLSQEELFGDRDVLVGGNPPHRLLL